jgi:hypothetical protein
MVLSPDFSGQTKFGLQPGRNHILFDAVGREEFNAKAPRRNGAKRILRKKTFVTKP